MQKKLFRRDYFPEYVMTPQEAQHAFIRGQGELVPLDELEGGSPLKGPALSAGRPLRRAGRTVVADGVQYFKALEEGSTSFLALPRKSRAYTWNTKTTAASTPTATC